VLACRTDPAFFIPLRTLTALVCAFLSFAAAPSGFPATSLRPEDLRVASVGYRLGLEGQALCPDQVPLTGLLLHHLAEYDGEGRATEIARHALDRGPGVLATVADSPAAQAGLMAGDVLISLNGAAFPDPRSMLAKQRRGDWRAPIEASEAWLEAVLRQGPAELRIGRGSQELTIRLQARQACPARVRLARSNQANAFATGTYVVVTTRMLDALRGEDELAIIIGHELAHNILRHEQRLDEQSGTRGNASRIRAAEEEADLLGLKLAAAAGYDVRAAIPMWRRLHAQFGGGLQLVRTHPSLKRREQLIEAAIEEIERTQAAPPPASPL